ncbi:MAG: putative transrane protein, partial [Frankiales bacterium]|nr:putative transrane protein [Frankiales bacterium]
MSSSLQERPPGSDPVRPSVEDPVVGGLVNAVGGAPGVHARTGERRFWTPVRWMVLLTLLTSLLGFWQKSPCRVHPWAEEYQYTRMCYSDVFALWGAERLSEGATPYLDHPVEYPVVIGAVMAAAESLADDAPSDARNRRFFDITWALLTACAVVVTLTTVRLAGRRRPWDAAMFAVAPALVLHHSTNWDLVAMAFAGLAMVAWARRAPAAAGVLLGVATATKLYPVLFLVPLLALCVRAGRLGAWFKAAVATGLTGLLLVVPVYLVSPSFADVGGTQTRVADSPLDRFDAEGLRALLPHVEVPSPADPAQTVEGTNSVYRFVALNQERGADWDSLYFALSKLKTSDDSLRNSAIGLVLDSAQPAGEPPSVLNRAVAVSFVLSLLAVCVLALRARRRPRVPQLLFLVLVAFLLTNKVFSPQYTIWLLPLAVLARPRWRPFLAWQATEALVLFTRFYYFISFGADQGIDYGWFLTAVLLRDLALLVMAGLVVRDVLRPERDVVRTEPISGLPSG